MQFTKDAHDGVASGKITLTFRYWQRPQVKVGGQYNVGPCRVEVDSIDLIPFAAVTNPDVRRSGSSSREALRQLIAHAGPVADDTIVYRIAFHRVGDRVGPVEIAPTQAAVTEANAKLDALDARGAHGPWTRRALRLIDDNPGVVSTVLAAQLDRDRSAFKADVRKLKALGLTQSLEVGYTLTPLGRATARW